VSLPSICFIVVVVVGLVFAGNKDFGGQEGIGSLVLIAPDWLPVCAWLVSQLAASQLSCI